MKIIYLLPLLKNTGPANVVVSLINSLSKTNHQIFVCCFLGIEDNYQNIFKNKNVQIVDLGGFNLKSILKLRQLIKNEKIDILHSHCLLADIANPLVSILNKNKSLTTVHCDLWADYKKEYSLLKASLYFCIHNLALSFINNIVSVSSGVATKLKLKSQIIYNGVPEQHIIRKPSEQLNLVFAGRLIPRKNILFLLDCIKNIQGEFKNIVLHIYGDGELFNVIQEKTSSIIKLHGFTENFVNKIPKNAIFINPSLAEGMPMAVLESIAAGIPTALSLIPPHKEIKQHISSGVETFDFNEKSLIKAIKKLTNSHNEVTFDSQRMLEDFGVSFSNKRMAKNYLDEYTKRR
ncbi:MAG: glycosyltransferase [Colwellia sp.]|nr:glycosyltransferase [Colwellia sp.]